MSDEKPVIGKVGWFDLTVPDADAVRAFYEAVVGWTSAAHPMGEYSDYEMKLPSTGQTVTGICHARGPNADLPPMWLPYVTVADLDASLAACVERGGTVIRPAMGFGSYGRIAVVRDPAGAAIALNEPAAG